MLLLKPRFPDPFWVVWERKRAPETGGDAEVMGQVGDSARFAQSAPNDPMLGRVEGPWTPRETSAAGQVFEFRLWAALTEQSRGSLHVFLPLADRGIDALVHRLSDGKYFEVQAKSRSTLMDGEVHLVVWAESLIHDELVIVAGLIVDGGLGPTVLVVPAAHFKRLANFTSNNGVPVYSMQFGMRPRSDSRWLPWLVPADRLAERFGVPVERFEEQLVEARPEWRSDLGFLGESEVTRLLAEGTELNLFRPFPDSETAELAVLHHNTRRVVGLQVKTVDVEETRLRATVNVYRPSFRPATTTYIVVLAWHRDQSRFHGECLLIPSVELVGIANDDGYGHLSFDWPTGSKTRSRIDEYGVLLSDVRTRILELTNQ